MLQDQINWKQTAKELYELLQSMGVNAHTAMHNYETTLQLENDAINFTRVNSDQKGNPRWVCWFGAFISEQDKVHVPLKSRYPLALKRAKQFGGQKFNNKQYGGGIVFQTYSVSALEKQIIAYMKTLQ